MRPVSLIVVHCSASPNGRRTTVADIDAWHAARGFRRDDSWRQIQNHDLAAIGYHYVIYPTGTVATGRHVDEVGAHAQGFNQRSIGICLAGTDRFTDAQWDSLAHLVTAEVARVTGRNGPADRKNPLTRSSCAAWADRQGVAIHGHRELPEVHKDCPGFSVADWLAGGLLPLPDHLLEDTHA